jgi:hypothetical protein
MNSKVKPAPAGPPLTEDELAAIERLDRVRGVGGLKSALLALLASPAVPGRLRTWREELADRQALLRSARRVLGPPGLPIDRLLWLAMRRHFGEHPLTPAHGANDPELSRLSIAELLHVAHFTAHLARMVPGDDPEEGQRWYQAVMARWLKPAETPPWQRPDVDALVHALNGLQGMSWMQRPQVVRTWVAAAMAGHYGGLAPGAADALRLSSLLLDSPMPPDLARQYAEISPD